MSYAIIRNEKYTSRNCNCIYRHNERKNTNYLNKDINKQNSINNYSIKTCNTTYLNRFNQLKKEYNLKGQIKKTSNILCEYVITSDKEFFESIGEEETKRYFETAYKFVASYKNLGEEFIVSAKVHMDENCPHMHLTFIPVVHKTDLKSGKEINKICCSDFWKGKDSYKRLQDSFYNYMIKSGFDLERGKEDRERKHILTKDYKELVNYEVKELFEETKNLENEVVTNDINILRENYKRVIRKFNTIAKRYTRVKSIVEDTIYKTEQVQNENTILIEENERLDKENSLLKSYIYRTKQWISAFTNWSIERVEHLLNDFFHKMEK